MHNIDWPKELTRLRKFTHPVHESMLGKLGLDYYWSAYQALLTALADGEFVCHGICNGDLAKRLYDTDNLDAAERRRASSRISYRLRIQRGHGRIHKIPTSKTVPSQQKSTKNHHFVLDAATCHHKTT